MKLPFIQFYPADYLRDTRALSCSAKGGWVDILMQLHGSATRGTLTLPVIGWARVMGANEAESGAIIDEIDVMKIADVTREGNGAVTITCRRMLRESITREQTRLRVRRHRSNKTGNADGNAPVTPEKPETRSQKPEAISADSAAASFEALGADTSPVVLTFLCNGRESKWDLHESFLSRLRELYPTVDVLAECKLALAKIQAGAVSRKTARGMPKFLFSWMDRSTNRRGGSNPPSRGSAGFA